MDVLGIEKCFARILPAVQNLKKSLGEEKEEEKVYTNVTQALIDQNGSINENENVICID